MAYTSDMNWCLWGQRYMNTLEVILSFINVARNIGWQYEVEQLDFFLKDAHRKNYLIWQYMVVIFIFIGWILDNNTYKFVHIKGIRFIKFYVQGRVLNFTVRHMKKKNRSKKTKKADIKFSVKSVNQSVSQLHFPWWTLSP